MFFAIVLFCQHVLHTLTEFRWHAVTVVKIREPLNPAMNYMRAWSPAEIHAHSCFIETTCIPGYYIHSTRYGLSYVRKARTKYILKSGWQTIHQVFNMQYIFKQLLLIESFQKLTTLHVTQYKRLFVRKACIFYLMVVYTQVTKVCQFFSLHYIHVFH